MSPQRLRLQLAMAQAAAYYASPVIRTRRIGGVACALLADGTVRWGVTLLAPGGSNYKRLRAALER